MAQVNFQREAGLVNGQGGSLLQNAPVCERAGDHRNLQLPEKCLPEGAVPIVQHSPGQTDGWMMFVHGGISTVSKIGLAAGGPAAGVGQSVDALGIIAQGGGKY